MKLRAIAYPNNEVRVALYPERLPKDYFKSASDLGESHENRPGINQSDGTLDASLSNLNEKPKSPAVQEKKATP